MTRVPVSWRAHEAVAMADRPKRRTRITVDLSDADAPMFVISVAAELSGMHPQTLRSYDRMGIVSPGRATGGGRRYSQRDIELLRAVAELTASGIGIEGVRRILELEHQVAALQARILELEADLLEAGRATSANLPAIRHAATMTRWTPGPFGGPHA
jgi:MerR family transcriptional regulator/heat shock protein HspR